MNNIELIESIESVIANKADYAYFKEIDDFVAMYYDNFPSMADIEYKGDLNKFFDSACKLYCLQKEEFITRLVFDPRANPKTMKIALWALESVSERKLEKMRLRYNDTRKRELHGTIIAAVSFLSINDTFTKIDTAGLDVDEIKEVLGRYLL